MGNSCIYIPKVRNGNTEVTSKLFTELTSLTLDREATKAIYGIAKVSEFIEKIEGIEYDSNGEPTVKSLQQRLALSNYFGGNITLQEMKVKNDLLDKNGKDILYSTEQEAVNKAISVNSNNDNIVANISKRDSKYIVTLEHKTDLNSKIPLELLKNNTLNSRLRGLMNKLGYEVQVKEGLTSNGIFNPTNTDTTVEGLRTIIHIAKGTRGQEAFPEEFSHFIIEALPNNELVKRILNKLDRESVKAILGDNYNRYALEYKNDLDTLKKEAAGQLLQAYITGIDKFGNNISIDNLLSRLWGLNLKMLSKLTREELDKIVNDTNQEFLALTDSILDGTILNYTDTSDILNSKSLQQLGDEINNMKDIAEEALKIHSKRLAIIRSRSKFNTSTMDEINSIKNIQALIDQAKYSKSALTFLNDITVQMDSLNNELRTLTTSIDRNETSLLKISVVSSVLRRIKEFSDGYKGIVLKMMNIEEMRQLGEVDISSEDALAISLLAGKIHSKINSIDNTYNKLRFDTVKNFITIYYGTEKVVDMGKHKGQVITVDMLLKEATRDINFIERWVSSMDNCGDPLLSMIDRIIKISQIKRDDTLREVLAGIRGVHNTYKQSANSNTDFMYERDENGKLTGRLISDRDFNRYEKERAEYLEELKNKYTEEGSSKYYYIKAKMDVWEEFHTESVFLYGKERRLPIYKTNALNQLTSAQREYYDEMIRSKAFLDDLLPENRTNLYNAIQIRNDLIEAVTDNANDPKKVVNMVFDTVKDNFVRRVDDNDFGDLDYGEESLVDDADMIDVDEEVEEVVVEKGEKKKKKVIKKKKVLLDFRGRPVERIPIFYVNKLENSDRLSTDFSGSMMNYAAMAINFHEMNKIVNALELTRDYVHEREVVQQVGGNSVTESFKVAGRKFEETLKIKGEGTTNISNRLNDYFASTIYGQHKLDEGYVEMFGLPIDIAKLADSARGYSSVVNMGLNIFSGISNVTQGMTQLMIEAVGNEFFNYKDLSKAHAQYIAMLPKYLAELNSTNQTNKFGLLADKFIGLGKLYEKMRNDGFYKGGLSRVIGNNNLFVLMEGGEHLLHSLAMLSMLNSYKVQDSTGRVIPIIDAYEVVEERSNSGKVISAQLKLKDGIKKEDGTDLTNNDIIQLQLTIDKVSRTMNGSYSQIDKGALHKYALGRMLMQFRQWIPEHVSRRFAKAQYNAQLDSWREGYYRTAFRFSQGLAKDLIKMKFQIATRWSELNSKEKANIKRALTELSIFSTIGLLIALMGGAEEHKGSWYRRMTLYQLKRLKMETGAFVPITTDIFSNAFTLINSPIAAVSTIDNILNVFEVQNMFNTIESGRYKGWNEYVRDMVKVLPAYGQVRKVVDITDEDYMYKIFN